MKFKRKDLAAIAGELWANGESYFLDSSEILRKFQQGIKKVGKKLHDEIELELDPDEVEQVKRIKSKLDIY